MIKVIKTTVYILFKKTTKHAIAVYRLKKYSYIKFDI